MVKMRGAKSDGESEGGIELGLVEDVDETVFELSVDPGISCREGNGKPLLTEVVLGLVVEG